MTSPAKPDPAVTDITTDLDFQLVELRHLVQQSMQWIGTHAVQIALAIIIGVCLYLLMNLLKRSLCRMKAKAGEEIGFTTLLARTFARTTHFFMAMAAARLVSGYAHPPEVVETTVRFIFTVAAVFQGAIWAREFILGLIEHRTTEDGRGETLANAMGLIRILVTFALFAIATIMVLDNLGVNVTGLVAGLGIGGIAIGLAAQGIFSDLFSALSIIFDKPFRQGDTIQFGTTTATVERIGLKSTRLRSVDGEQRIISNAKLLEQEISNFSDVALRRYRLTIALVYQTPADKADRVPEIVQGAVEEAGAVFQRAGFTGFGPSSLDYDILFFVRGHDLDEVARIRHKVGMSILRHFAAEGLEFAYPTQTTFTAAPDGSMIWPYARPNS